MARRQLLKEGERCNLIGLSTDAASIASHYTLSADDLELVSRRHGATNRLGMAVQIALMRHPGFGLQPDLGVPVAILHKLADQLAIDPDVVDRIPQGVDRSISNARARTAAERTDDET
ncbi:MAG: DUF4158 domain-containing protein [Sphingobium sp.]